jgi:xylulose-5-phosphate/fructose-6-phosphate phosphoketolase
MNTPTLSTDLLGRIDAYWRAANYLSVGQMYLYDNPLLKRPLVLADVKRMLLGHWGTTPGQNFIYVHLNRVIKKYDLDMIYVSGPGHGGPAVVANTYLEGTYSEIYPRSARTKRASESSSSGFRFRGASPAMRRHECPGSIHEAVSWAIAEPRVRSGVRQSGAHRRLRRGDGEAGNRTDGHAWPLQQVLDPATDGAVLPILHLNGSRLPTRRSSPASPAKSGAVDSAATGGRPTSSRSTSRRNA